MHALLRLRPDSFTIALVCTVALASLFPAHGISADIARHLAVFAIAALFFFQGARLSRQAVLAGFIHWRLHTFILFSTFMLFPALGRLLATVLSGLLTPDLWLGVLFLCALPSTVQSSIAFTSIGRGNVPAAICAATASNLIGILITPVLVGVLLSLRGRGFSGAEIGRIVLQLLVPFLAGQLLRPIIGEWARRNRSVVAVTDRGSILLVVYTAFSEAVIKGIWHQVPPVRLGLLLVVSSLLLGLVLLVTSFGSRLLGFSRADEIAIVFCGSKKTLATGVPMANILFPGPAVGMIVLPLMVFHQMQLMVCAVIARRYAASFEAKKLRPQPPLESLDQRSSPGLSS